MAIPTHYINDLSFESFVDPGLTLYQFRTPLDAFDGRKYYARYLSKLPHPGWSEDFTESELNAAKRFFIQAGGRADRMTLEVRQKSGDREVLYVIGHSPAEVPSSAPQERIEVGDNVTYVYPHELFEAEEAAQIFYDYYLTNAVSEGYSLRELTLD